MKNKSLQSSVPEIHKLTVREILLAHDKYQKATPLDMVLGDGFLYSKGRIYKKLRDAIEKLGYSFTTEDFCGAASYSLLALPEILKSKKMPVFDSIKGLRRVEKLRPRQFKLIELHPLKRPMNSLLHESSHCLAQNFLPIPVTTKVTNAEQLREHLVILLLHEAFALTVELFSCLEAKSAPHQFFLRENAFVGPFLSGGKVEAKMKFLKESVELLGMTVAFQTVMLMEMYNLFLYKTVGTNELLNVLELFDYRRHFTAQQTSSLLKGSTLRMTGDKVGRFVIGVNSSFLKFHLGTKKDVFSLLQFDFFKVLQKNPNLVKKVNEMTSFITS